MHLSDTEAAQRVADNDNLVGELVEALEECVEDSEEAVADHILKFGENYRPTRLAYMREKVRKARALIAKVDGEQQ